MWAAFPISLLLKRFFIQNRHSYFISLFRFEDVKRYSIILKQPDQWEGSSKIFLFRFQQMLLIYIKIIKYIEKYITKKISKFFFFI